MAIVEINFTPLGTSAREVSGYVRDRKEPTMNPKVRSVKGKT